MTPRNRCDNCGRDYTDWAADNDLWALLAPEGGMLCFDCFAARAHAHDVLISVERWFCDTCDDVGLEQSTPHVLESNPTFTARERGFDAAKGER